MKLECVRDSVAFFGFQITKGKIYEGTPVVWGDRFQHIRFVVYNDANKWEVYDADCFIPVSVLSESASPGL